MVPDKSIFHGLGSQFDGSLHILAICGMEVPGAEHFIRRKQDISGIDLGFIQNGMKLLDEFGAHPFFT